MPYGRIMPANYFAAIRPDDDAPDAVRANHAGESIRRYSPMP